MESIIFGFAVKIPMIPLHIWLPEAHVEAPTSGSVLLAGILLKLGGYAFIKFLAMLFFFGSFYFNLIVYLLSILAISLGSLITLRQIDLKKIIAYSSVVHMNFSLLGIFSLSIQGIVGSIILMVSHGFVSSGLFLSVGVLYDRYHTRILKYFGGFNYFYPLMSIVFLILTLGNISFPGTISFLGEILILLSVLNKNFILSLIVILSGICGTIYALWLYTRLFSGQIIRYKVLLNWFPLGLTQTSLNFSRLWSYYFIDLNYREFLIFVPLILSILYFGLNPAQLIDLNLNFILNKFIHTIEQF